MPEQPPGRPTTLTGWGRTAPTVARLVDAPPAELPGLVTAAGPRGIVARGLGRSYGDAAQNAGGLVVAPLEPWVHLDLERPGGPVAEVSAGTSLHDLMGHLLPAGHFVPVTPGTRYVTVGGAVAADVHGKSHHRDGSFGDHVVALDLLGADGETRTLTPDGPDRRAFWATVGGMGLTGIVTRATLRVRPVGSAYVRVHTERLPDLARLMTRMREADRTSTYSVAWIDTVSRGRALGRSVLTLGEHADADELGRRAARRWAPPGDPAATFPGSPVNLITRLSTRAFSELWYRKAPAHRDGEIQSIGAFFHPLDGVAAWNRVYAGSGFVQYQFVIPDAAEDALPGIFERLVHARLPSFLSVLKRFGPGNRGMLSFPMAGWTLAIDVPTAAAATPLLGELDREVAGLGGRVYLAKDSRLDPEVFARMYPRLEEFRRTKAAMDPEGVFRSDLARRLKIVEGQR